MSTHVVNELHAKPGRGDDVLGDTRWARRQHYDDSLTWRTQRGYTASSASRPRIIGLNADASAIVALYRNPHQISRPEASGDTDRPFARATGRFPCTPGKTSHLRVMDHPVFGLTLKRDDERGAAES
jgi:hypothetical protein